MSTKWKKLTCKTTIKLLLLIKKWVIKQLIVKKKKLICNLRENEAE